MYYTCIYYIYKSVSVYTCACALLLPYTCTLSEDVTFEVLVHFMAMPGDCQIITCIM